MYPTSKSGAIAGGGADLHARPCPRLSPAKGRGLAVDHVPKKFGERKGLNARRCQMRATVTYNWIPYTYQ